MYKKTKSFLRKHWHAFCEHYPAALAAKATIAGLSKVDLSLAATAVLVGAVWLWYWFRENWGIALGSLGILVAIAYNIFSRRNARTYDNDTAELLKFKSLTESCGIEAIHPLNTPEEKETGWKACVEKITQVRHRELCLAVFTGGSTFSYEPSDEDHYCPLRDALDNHRGHLRILVMKKGCDAWKDSANAFGKRQAEHDKYKIDLEDAYNKAKDFCQHLANKHHSQLKSIEVRAYDRPPLWKMVIMEEHIWVQHYFPGQHVDDRPAFVVNDNANGMAHALKSVFEYRWDRSEVVIPRRGDRPNNSASHTPQASVHPPPS